MQYFENSIFVTKIEQYLLRDDTEFHIVSGLAEAANSNPASLEGVAIRQLWRGVLQGIQGGFLHNKRLQFDSMQMNPLLGVNNSKLTAQAFRLNA